MNHFSINEEDALKMMSNQNRNLKIEMIRIIMQLIHSLVLGTKTINLGK